MMEIGTMAAVRLARAVTKKTGILKVEGAYHGGADMFLVSTGVPYNEMAGPSWKPSSVIEFDGIDENAVANTHIVQFNDLESLEYQLKQHEGEIACFIIEPCMTNGGVIPPDPGYLGGVRELTLKHNVMLILDEIQTGLGRTGKLLAEEHEGIEADLTLIGKALSGGFYPVSAVLSNSEVMDVLNPGEHGSTFGGNPLAAAVARTSLRVLIEEDLIGNAAKMGTYFLEELKKIDQPLIKEVRGRGLMIAVEFHPEAGGARQYVKALAKKGLLCKETHVNTIRLAPPLVISKDEIDWALKIIKEVIQ